jgi:hypothetical protein
MVELVSAMLDLPTSCRATSASPTPTVPGWPTMLQRQIDMTDRQPSQLLLADRLEYELYELTQEKIAIVEGS